MRAFLACLLALTHFTFVAFPADAARSRAGHAAPAPTVWHVAQTEGFRLFRQQAARADAPADLAAQAAALETLRRGLDRLGLPGADPGGDDPEAVPPPLALDVFLVPDLARLMPWQPLSPLVGGFYRADTGRVSAVVADRPGAPGGFGALNVLFHEYAHHWLLARPGRAWPAWYVEGFAEYVATARIADGVLELGGANRGRVHALRSRPWIPLADLLGRAVDPHAPGHDAQSFYAQSWLLAHYLHHAPGMASRLGAWFDAIAQGQEPVAAFRAHVEADLSLLERQLRRWLDGPMPTITIAPEPGSAPIAVAVHALPASADRLLGYQLMLEHGVRPPSRAQGLAEVRALAAAHPHDDLAMRVLALAELTLGAPAQAALRLDHLLAAAPDDPDLLRWRADAARPGVSPAHRAEARRFADRALAAAPDDWRVLHLWARLNREPDGAPTPHVVAHLEAAWRRAPQVPQLVLDTALMLGLSGRFEEAGRVLEPLAFSPHGGMAQSLARRLLDRAREGDAPGLRAAFLAPRILLDVPPVEGAADPGRAADAGAGQPAVASR